MTRRELLCWGRERLAQAGIGEARLDAWYLMESSFSISREAFLLDSEKEAEEEKAACYRELIEKRSRHIPLQHLTGVQEFMGFPFQVSEAVLIPRQDTEILVEEALKAGRGKKVLDLCTGSGCIIISICKLGGPQIAVASDLSAEALEVAKRNAAALDAEVTFVESDLFEKVKGRFDVIVSNPPYIESQEIGRLMPEVRDYEPRLALDGKEDGLYFYRRIIGQAPEFLEEGGQLLLEIGWSQGEAVKDLLQKAGFREIRVQKDLAGLDRVAIGKR